MPFLGFYISHAPQPRLCTPFALVSMFVCLILYEYFMFGTVVFYRQLFSGDLRTYCHHLRMNDLLPLMQVSKPYMALGKPICWTRIELHHRNFHIQTSHEVLREEVFANRQQLPYDDSPNGTA
jgi:hypothetical protein